MTDFATGQLVLITTPDKDGLHMIAVVWCVACYALVPEDFIGAHIRLMHPDGGSDS